MAAAVTSAVIAIAGVVLGWIAVEIACKPCLDKGRQAIDRSLNLDYDPDDDQHLHAPLNPSQSPQTHPPPLALPNPNPNPTNGSHPTTTEIKTV